MKEQEASITEEKMAEETVEKGAGINPFWLILKNTVLFMIPFLVVSAIILGIIFHYPILYQNEAHFVSSLEEMQEWYERKCYNVRYTASELKYTGYDYYANGKRIGAYYYSFVGNKCLFVLVHTKEPQPVILNKNIKGRLLFASVYGEAMLDEFADDIGFEKEEFQSIVYPLMLSEIDYPLSEMIVIWVLIILPCAVSITMVILAIGWILRPYMHPSTKELKEYGDRRLIYQEIRRQMKQADVIHKENYYFTEDYLIISHWFDTDFIRIDQIQYISKHAVNLKKRKDPVYRLTMSNDKRIHFERNFRSEESVDTLMAEMIRRNEAIDDQTLKIFRLDVKEEEQANKTSEVIREAVTEPVSHIAMSDAAKAMEQNGAGITTRVLTDQRGLQSGPKVSDRAEAEAASKASDEVGTEQETKVSDEAGTKQGPEASVGVRTEQGPKASVGAGTEHVSKEYDEAELQYVSDHEAEETRAESGGEMEDLAGRGDSIWDEDEDTAQTFGDREGKSGSEGVKIYSIRRRLKKNDRDKENVKIYKVKRRLKKEKEAEETTDDPEEKSQN